MDPMYFINVILQQVNPLVSVIVVALMEIIRRIIPTPASADNKREVPEWVRRYVFSFLPYALGIALVYAIDGTAKIGCTNMILKGFFSALLADVAYRKFKVVILGA